MDIGLRLRSLREKNGLTQEEVGKKIGVTKATVNRYETGEIDIKRTVAIRLAKVLNSTPAYIMGWDNNVSGYSTYTPTHKIPILGYISAGLPLFADEQVEGYLYTDLNNDGNYFALRIRGDSMNAANIPDSSIVIVHQQVMVANGEIAAVRVNGENATVKRFRKHGDIIQLIPQSYNPEHQIQIYDLKKDKIEIIGKIVRCEIEF